MHWQAALTAVSTTVVAGILLALITTRIQSRRERESIRRDLISRLAELTTSLQYRVEHHRRRVNHGQYKGAADLQATDAKALEDRWIEDQSKLRALHIEIDAYFGTGGAGLQLHYLRDLLLIQYMKNTNVPLQQRDEAIKATVEPPHHEHILKATRSDKDWDREYTHAVGEVVRHLRRDSMRKPYGATRFGFGVPR